MSLEIKPAMNIAMHTCLRKQVHKVEQWDWNNYLQIQFHHIQCQDSVDNQISEQVTYTKFNNNIIHDYDTKNQLSIPKINL